ncbi:BTAD domain-containing putative transcriptional regulator [Mesorhizobium sp. CAU 1732]|uniref:BTAD domain-containing putative transcriptional regulator n=1 Tax=Mesorhizobium sp. CAU 1732 TaxID=3140358 RepID=UPI003261CEE5
MSADNVLSTKPALQIMIVGEPAFVCEGRRARTLSRKADALLAYLCASETGEVSRQFAAGLLWSTSSEERARTSLRQVVRSIRHALEMVGFDGFHAYKETLAVDRSRVQVDLKDLLASIRDGILPDSTLLHELRYGNRILHGCDDLDDSFSAWARVQRQFWGDMFLDAIEKQFQSETADVQQREDWAKALIAFDPSHEPATRFVMHARAVQGNQSGALQIYNTLWRTLDEEFDAEPAPETQKLYADIKLGLVGPREVSPPSLAPALPLSDDAGPVLIVAAVDESDPKSALSRTIAGLRLELISLLVRFREWTVVDWADSGVAGQRPAYAILLSGRQVGDEMAYSLNLRDERDGRFIWGETVRGGVEQLCEAQETFVRRMASTLNMHLSADRLRRLPGHSVLPESHFDTWVRAQQHMHRWRDSDDMEALDLLQSIIRDVPGFGPAHSALAQHANGRHIVCPGSFRDADTTQMALDHARTARLLDPLDAKAHLSLGWSHALLEQFGEAENAYRTALQLNGNDPWVLTSATHGLAFCGAKEEAGALARRIVDMGVTLAPQHWSYLAGIHYLSDDFDAALDASSRVEHSYYGMKTWTIAALCELGHAAKARKEATDLYRSLSLDWRSKKPPSPRVAGDWLADMFPIRDGDTRTRIRNSLANSGLA